MIQRRNATYFVGLYLPCGYLCMFLSLQNNLLKTFQAKNTFIALLNI